MARGPKFPSKIRQVLVQPVPLEGGLYEDCQKEVPLGTPGIQGYVGVARGIWAPFDIRWGQILRNSPMHSGKKVPLLPHINTILMTHE